jgi:hypothetical protein
MEVRSHSFVKLRNRYTRCTWVDATSLNSHMVCYLLPNRTLQFKAVLIGLNYNVLATRHLLNDLIYNNFGGVVRVLSWILQSILTIYLYWEMSRKNVCGRIDNLPCSFAKWNFVISSINCVSLWWHCSMQYLIKLQNRLVLCFNR